MKPQPPLSATLILLTYSPKDGVDDTAYESWIAEVDNPFFNSVPGIVRYTNWKVSSAPPDLSYSHFDLLEIENEDAFDAVWNNVDLTNFRQKWRELWGRTPTEDSPLNSHAYLSSRVSGAPQPLVDGIRLKFEPASTEADFESWRVVSSIKGGTQRFSNFALSFIPAANESVIGELVAGQLIAAPNWSGK